MRERIIGIALYAGMGFFLWCFWVGLYTSLTWVMAR